MSPALAVVLAVLMSASWALLFVLLYREADHRRRLERKEAGLPELPRRRTKPAPEIPADILELIEPFESPMVKQYLKDQVRDLLVEGNRPEHIKAMLAKQLEDAS